MIAINITVILDVGAIKDWHEVATRVTVLHPIAYVTVARKGRGIEKMDSTRAAHRKGASYPTLVLCTPFSRFMQIPLPLPPPPPSACHTGYTTHGTLVSAFPS